jgi:hypothetical protein
MKYPDELEFKQQIDFKSEQLKNTFFEEFLPTVTGLLVMLCLWMNSTMTFNYLII